MLKGLAVADFRSIGNEQELYPLGKINLFVGANNAGKSNILRFIDQNLVALIEKTAGRGTKLAVASQPHNRRNQPTTARLCVTAKLEDFKRLLKPQAHHTRLLVESIHRDLTVEDTLWLQEGWPNNQLVKDILKRGEQGTWRDLWSNLTNQGSGSPEAHWVPESLRMLKRLMPDHVSVYSIPIDRKANSTSTDPSESATFTPFTGAGVVKLLASMQNPDEIGFEDNQKKFNAIQNFTRIVTDDASAEIHVPYTQDKILVRFKHSPFMPLALLGSGVEQVILHAVAATSTSNSIVTFEEPELHLHPVLQKQLLSYLAKTDNQYFVSTHSAHMIDAVHSNTFHVRLINGESRIEFAATDSGRHRVCFDLGYRPSDLVQANCIVWVEGPSDRIYVRGWLAALDPHLNENVHYSVMFYGGKLLSHLSANETDVADDNLSSLIHLRLLNRHVAVLMDSDLSSGKENIRATKARVRDEIMENGGFVWITAGREIENYVQGGVLKKAVEAIATGRGASVKAGRFAKTLPPLKAQSRATVDKVAVASQVMQQPIDLGVLDLREKLADLANFVRISNGLAPLMAS